MNAYFGRMYVYSDRDRMIKIPFSTSAMPFSAKGDGVPKYRSILKVEPSVSKSMRKAVFIYS